MSAQQDLGMHLRQAGIDTWLHSGGPKLPTLEMGAVDWGPAAAVAKAQNWRWAGSWADADAGRMHLYALLAQGGEYLLLTAQAPLETPEFTSHTPHYPAADRLERHAQDLFGVIYSDHPDGRRWTRHQAWPQAWHPLHPAAGARTQGRTAADSSYPFTALRGDGVFEIPVGPVHAGIIEPGHFRFHAAGETVLRLEERLGYTHKGIEALAVGRNPAALLHLAARVSGDSAVTHAWAASQAMERAVGATVSPRALALRGLLAERERVANHIGDIGAICNDVGFAFAQMQTSRLRECWQRRNREIFSHRLLMDTVVPGGVVHDLDAAQITILHADHANLRKAIEPLFNIFDDHPSLEDRLVTTGHLSAEDAVVLGCTGYVGRASGQALDLRHDAPYAPYHELCIDVPVQSEGDVAARIRVRMAEVRMSLDLMDQLLRTLPGGGIHTSLPDPPATACGLGLIEGWRGETLAFVRFDASGHIARYFPRDASWFIWPALERLIHGNIVADFPVCNKSVNGSYAGVDL